MVHSLSAISANVDKLLIKIMLFHIWCRFHSLDQLFRQLVSLVNDGVTESRLHVQPA